MAALWSYKRKIDWLVEEAQCIFGKAYTKRNSDLWTYITPSGRQRAVIPAMPESVRMSVRSQAKVGEGRPKFDGEKLTVVGGKGGDDDEEEEEDDEEEDDANDNANNEEDNNSKSSGSPKPEKNPFWSSFMSSDAGKTIDGWTGGALAKMGSPSPKSASKESTKKGKRKGRLKLRT
jgi:hypothetical protein